MKLILARHGNTFEAHESAYYVGSQHDLPLVPFGMEQAQAIGQALHHLGCHVTSVYTGPLKRARSTAQIALTVMHSSVQEVVDERLNELDYGLWSGLTSQEVRQRFGDAEYEAWERQSQWPAGGEWGETEQEVMARIGDFVNDLVKHHAEQDTVLVVSSNGCLRYFLKLVPGLFEQYVAQRQLKIGTGHLCQLTYEHKLWTLDYWNQAPANLLADSVR